MDMYLLGDMGAPAYAAEDGDSPSSRDSQSLNSDLTSQKSHIYQQRSMPNFLQQLHVSVEQRGFGLNRDQLKKIK